MMTGIGVQHRSESVFTFGRNRCSGWSGIRTTQGNTYGLRVKHHRERGEAVHLFVRRHRKLNGGSAPFVYCGEVEFARWTGERPITVRWTLKEPVPQRLWAELKVPGPPAT
jgi:hypothetical protein